MREVYGQRVAEMRDRNPSGLCEITDTRWDGNGTLYVTVRELIGQPIDRNMLARMRRLARRALMYAEQTRSSRVVRQWYAQGSWHVTFAVSRLDGR